MKMTWEECAAAWMSQAEAAQARGKSISAASHYAKRNGLAFRDDRRGEANAERLRARRADPAVDMRQQHIRALDAAGLLDEYWALTRKRYSKAKALAALGVSV